MIHERKHNGKLYNSFKVDLNNFLPNSRSGHSKQMTDKSEPEKSDSKLDTYEDQSSPIENEEWLAFIHMTMQEVLNDEIDTLKHHNLVRFLSKIQNESLFHRSK